MPLSQRQGDLFASTDLDALAHGCNCYGVMGAGIAALFSRKWPQMFKQYRKLCKAGEYQPGDCFSWQDGDSPVIYNLATQLRPGRDARLEAVAQSVQRMLDDATERGVKRIGLPQIGAGIGGLVWDDVEQVLRAAADTTDIELVVHVL